MSACAPHTAQPTAPVTAPERFSASGPGDLPARWWRVFGDEELNRMVRRALDDNFDLAVAWQRLRAARALVELEEAALYPDLEASVRREERRGDVEPGPDLQLGLSSVYEVDLWGRIDSAVEAEHFRARATGADYQAAALSLAAEIVRTWYGIAEARHQLGLLGEQVSVNRQTLELLENRFGVGLVPAVDVLRQRSLLEATKEQRYYAEAQLEVLRHQLAVLLGTPPTRPLPEMPEGLPLLPPLPETGMPAALVRRRPDVRAAHLSLEAADRELAAAIANQFPRLTLSVSASSAADSAGALLDDWLISLGGQLVAPLFKGGARRAEVERSEAVRSQRLYEYGQSVLVAFREVENALVRERRQQLGLESLERQVELAGEAHEQLRIQYFNGAADYLDVLTAREQLQQLQRSRLDAHLTLVDYRVALYRALAGPFETDRESEEGG